MKKNQFNLMAAGVAALVITLTACNNNRENSTDRNSDEATKDTNLTDTRRNSGDTVNYLTKDSGNQSQETIDPNPPQNSR
jgi:hypothetical protein